MRKQHGHASTNDTAQAEVVGRQATNARSCLARASTQSLQGLRVYVPCLAHTPVASGLELFRLWKS